MEARTLQKDSQNKDVRPLLRNRLRALRRPGLVCFIALLGAVTLWSQTQHSITVVISNYAQGTDAATGINFYRSTVSGGPYTKLNPVPVPLASKAAQFVDTTGVGGTMYFYVATAVDATGFESAFGGEASATFLANPAVPPAVTLIVK